jgi:hypothetical protein
MSASAAEERRAQAAEEGYDWNIEEAIAAFGENLEVIRTRPDILLLDLDSETAHAQYKRNLSLLQKHFGLVEVDTYRSKSMKENHWHVVVKCDPCDITTRIALQLALGSDYRREGMALMMIQDGIENPSFLYKPKAAKIPPIEITKILTEKDCPF